MSTIHSVEINTGRDKSTMRLINVSESNSGNYSCIVQYNYRTSGEAAFNKTKTVMQSVIGEGGLYFSVIIPYMVVIRPFITLYGIITLGKVGYTSR